MNVCGYSDHLMRNIHEAVMKSGSHVLDMLIFTGLRRYEQHMPVKSKVQCDSTAVIVNRRRICDAACQTDMEM